MVHETVSRGCKEQHRQIEVRTEGQLCGQLWLSCQIFVHLQKKVYFKEMTHIGCSISICNVDLIFLCNLLIFSPPFPLFMFLFSVPLLNAHCFLLVIAKQMNLMVGDVAHLLDLIWLWISPSDYDQHVFR